MKKLYKVLAAAAAAAVMFSCAKEENQPDEIIPQSEDQPQEVTGGDQEGTIEGEGLLLSFGATTEAVKASIDDAAGTVTLGIGDEVLVYSAGKTGKYIYDGTQFAPAKEGDAVAISADVEVFYPFTSFALATDHIEYTMPAAVTSLEDLGDKNPLAGKLTGEPGNYSAHFKAVGAILKVGITGNRTLTKVTLGNGALSIGEGAHYTIGWSSEAPTMTTTETETKSIDIASSALLSDTPTTFYYILPTVALTGVTVQAYTTTSDYFAVDRGDWTPDRNKIYKMSFYAGLFSGGEGTTENPYKIANARDFKNISKYSKVGYGSSLSAASFLAAHYIQTADIDFNRADLSAFMIATASNPFTGTYNGNNKTLSNFTITGTPSGNEGVAPFKAINGAVLQNIAISGAKINGGKFTAGLVGYATGAGATIQNCSIESSTISDSGNDFGAAGLIGGIYGGTVTNCSGTDLTISTDVANKAYFGGIITYINGAVTVSRCELNGTTTVTNAQKFGGIIGQINNVNVRIEDCHNHSTINGSKNYNGGICGYAKLGTISNCTNDGAVNGLSSTAGIVAQLDGATVDHCTNSGTIHGSENYAAGIVAYHTKGNLTNSVNTGAISADGNYVGGIAGMLKSSANYGLIKGCRSNATLNGANDVAGIVGRVTWGIVMDCFAKGTATGGLNTGGIVGYAYSADGNVAVMNCLSNVAVTCNASGNQHSGGVIGRATCVDSKYVYIGNCAGLNNLVKATESNAVRFGAFTGFTNAEKKSGSATPNRVRIWNSYSLVDDTHFQCANTSATADVGGFVGCMGAASDLGDCYYINDDSKSTLNGSTYKNITQTTAAVIGGTGNIAVNPTRQGLNLDDTFLNVLNRCTYASNGTTRLTAFNDYPMCDWTMTGANGEALSHPVPQSLVALGAEFYE